MRLLILAIYHETEYYKEMLNVQQIYIQTIKNIYKNIDYFFISLNPNQEDKIIINYDTNMIYVKGEECLLNITYKTIEAIKFMMNLNYYDYIIRTNISTIININNLVNFLSEMPKTNVYSGGISMSLRWYDTPAGINSDTYEKYNLYRINYFQGTGIIFSNDVITNIINNENNIIHEIVDDVSFGLYIRDYFPEIYETINTDKNTLARTEMNSFNAEAIFIRNRLFCADNVNRTLDISRMSNIINYLVSNEKINILNSFPKIIHLTHKNYESLQISSQAWSSLNPEYKIELYDDERCIQELRNNFGELYCDIFNYIPDGQIKSDFFRICILYIYGGVYSDNDVIPYVPIREFAENNIDFLTCISYNYKLTSESYNYNPQFIISKPKNEYLYDVIKKYLEMYINGVEYKYWDWSICKHMMKIYNFDISPTKNNIFHLNGKIYKFLIETVETSITNKTYNFNNLNHVEFSQNHEGEIFNVYCYDRDVKILNNFANK